MKTEDYACLYQDFLDRGYEVHDAEAIAMCLANLVCSGHFNAFQIEHLQETAMPEAWACSTLRESPEGSAYWDYKFDNVRWLAYERKAKWTHVPQKGEMAYNQPYFTVGPQQQELDQCEKGQLLIARREQEIKNLITGESQRLRENIFVRLCEYPHGARFKIHCSSNAQVSAMANWFGDRLPPKFYEHYKNVLVRKEPT